MIARWSLLVCVYAAWNIIAYCSMNIWGWDRDMYDYSYWVGERVFVLTAFLVVLAYVEKKYKWLIKTISLVAIWKLVYLILVVTGQIQKNDFQSLMGIVFILVIAIIVIGWERLSKR